MSKKILPPDRLVPKKVLVLGSDTLLEIEHHVHPVQLALSKAEACRQLLNELDAGTLSLNKQILDWIGSIASEALGRALVAAGSEFLMLMDGKAQEGAAA